MSEPCHFDIYGIHAIACDSWLPDGECSCKAVRHICTRCMRPAEGDCLTRTCTEPTPAHQHPRMTDAP